MIERVYFFELDNLIKIGTTWLDVKTRLRQVELQISSGPITLIGAINGSFALERAIHHHLKAHRRKGEWFNACAAVRACVDGLLAHGPSHIGFDQSIAPMGKRAREYQEANSPESRAQMFGRIARLIWPDTAIAELCAFTGEDERTVACWLEGSMQPPRLVRFAFGSIVASFIVPDTGFVASFVDCDPDDFRKLPLPMSAA